MPQLRRGGRNHARVDWTRRTLRSRGLGLLKGYARPIGQRHKQREVMVSEFARGQAIVNTEHANNFIPDA